MRYSIKSFSDTNTQLVIRKSFKQVCFDSKPIKSILKSILLKAITACIY